MEVNTTIGRWPLARADYAERAQRVDLEVGARVFDRGRYGHLSGEVVDHIHLGARGCDSVRVANVCHDEAKRLWMQLT